MSRKLWTTLAAGSLLAVFVMGSASCSSDEEEPANGVGGHTHEDGSNSAGAVAPEELSAFCSTLATFFCDRCSPLDTTCAGEMQSGCSQFAAERDPGGYTKAKGQACLDALATVDCENQPLNCQSNLAVAECNNYLAGRTDGVDPACP